MSKICEQINKAITVYVPGNVCNLRCSYCYVSECLQDGHEEIGKFRYSVEHMIYAFRPERIGGRAYITVIGAGETLVPQEVVPFVKGLLRLGHVVEVVTNNTLNQRISELLEAPEEDLRRLIVKGSLHWKELKRLNKVQDYFNNIKRILKAGASSYPFLVLSEEYMQDLDEICETCVKELGELPQCTPCVTAETREDFLKGGSTLTSPACTPEFIKKVDEKLHSKLFNECVRFLDIDVKRVFCYAGKWSFGVGMGDGTICKCHNVVVPGNFFENIDAPYEGEAVGCECGIASCCLQYPLYGLGLIPEIKNVPTYTEMICDRETLFSNEVKELMNIKISDNEKVFSNEEKISFLMQRIEDKDNYIKSQGEKLNEITDLINQYTGLYETSDIQLVENILDILQNKGDINQITYKHIKALKSICEITPNGDHIYEEILKKIYNLT